MENKITIPANGKIRVYWDDKPENYTKQAKSQVRTHFSKKYNVSRKSINVIFRPIKIDKDGNRITITGANLENVMDANYQRQLMKEWLEREDKKVEYDDIINIDDKVNMEVQIDMTELRQRKYTLKWIKFNNFLCFGDVKPIHINRLNGLVCVTSEPKNQGGKTTLSIDAPLFLFFGRTTKTDKNEDIFNLFSDGEKLEVRGMIEIDDAEYLIERKMTRKPKKGGGWTVTNKVNYVELLPDGTEKEQNEEDAKETTKLIRDTIGSEEDFMMTILATSKNLEDLIDSKPTEKGKLISRFVGLEVIEEKERIVRKMYNDFAKTMKSNHHNIIDLEEEINELEEENATFEGLLGTNQTNLEDKETEIQLLNTEKDTLFNKKQHIDEDVLKLSPKRLKEDIADITKKGKIEAEKMKKVVEEIVEIGEVDFDEDTYHSLGEKKRKLEKSIDKNDNEVERLEQRISDLEESEICPTCKRPLDDVDNSEEIKNEKISLEETKKKIKTQKQEVNDIIIDIEGMEENQKLSTNKTKLELQRDRIDVDLASMRNELKSLKNDQKKYDLNVKSIEFNKKIESEILGTNSKIQMATIDRDRYVSNIEKIKTDIDQNNKDIKTFKDLIVEIKEELVKEKNYKVYIDMVGKKGISKIVLRSVLPIINSELHRLLDEVTDFEVEMQINEKNDVEFYLIKDGITKKLKSGSGLERTTSSLALRFVLGQISSLPKPNFIAFDEVLGGSVAPENLDTAKLLFDKATDMFETIFIITHMPVVKDWADKHILVEKKDNVSQISVQ